MRIKNIEVSDKMIWNTGKVLYKKKKAGIYGVSVISVIILMMSCFTSFTVIGIGPHPIWGYATWEGGGNADGASVAVTSSLGTLSTTVSSGAWQVDCGSPGPDWPIGTGFMVTITGSGSHAGWLGNTAGTVSGYSNNMNNIVVYNDAPSNPSTPSGSTSLETGVSASYSTSATDSGEQVQYRFDWDANGAHEYSGWTSLVPSGTSGSMSHSWGFAGTYVVKTQAMDEYGKTSSGWSSGLSVVVTTPPNAAPNTPSTPSGSTALNVGVSTSYSTSATDSESDQVQYMFDWDAAGAHEYSSWTSLVPSGTSESMSHSWGSAGIYMVKVKAKDEHGLESGWSSGLSVVITAVNNAPNTPSDPSPANGSTNVGVTTDIGWTGSDPDAGDSVTYDVYFGSWITPSKVSDNQSGISYDTGTMGYNTVYYWRIVAWDNHGVKTSGSLWHFTTEQQLNNPPVFETPSPANGSSGNRLSFSWSIPINDLEGNTFLWTIQCSNGQTSTATGASNGTKSLALSGLTYSTSYKVWVNATDPTSSGLYTRRWYTFTTQQRQNVPPNKPNKPSGIKSGMIDIVYTYTSSTTDPNGDQVYYMWNWGDGSQSGWLGPYNSGVTIITSHMWTVKGSYSIKVKAKDTFGAESKWSKPLSIKIRLSQNAIEKFIDHLISILEGEYKNEIFVQLFKTL